MAAFKACKPSYHGAKRKYFGLCSLGFIRVTGRLLESKNSGRCAALAQWVPAMSQLQTPKELVGGGAAAKHTPAATSSSAAQKTQLYWYRRLCPEL